jgi:hypothetical protein
MAVIGPRTEIIITPVAPTTEARPIKGMALIDTGARVTVVARQMAYDSKFRNSDLVQACGLNRKSQAPVFDVEVELPEFNIKRSLKIVGFELEHKGIVALIGRDLLADCVLIYDGKGGTAKLTT